MICKDSQQIAFDLQLRQAYGKPWQKKEAVYLKRLRVYTQKSPPKAFPKPRSTAWAQDE